MPELRKDDSLKNKITVNEDTIVVFGEGTLGINSYKDQFFELAPSEARAYCEIIAGWYGGTVTWACSETSDSGEEIGGNGTAAKPELEAAGGAPKITPTHAEMSNLLEMQPYHAPYHTAIHTIHQLYDDLEKLKAEKAELVGKLKDMHRRAQAAESALPHVDTLRKLVDGSRPVGGGIAKKLLGASWIKIEAENAELRARVERLPVTADGVPVYPGMRVWTIGRRPGNTEICECEVDRYSMWAPSVWNADGPDMPRAKVLPDGGRWEIHRCYSTREAAEAAAKGGGE